MFSAGLNMKKLFGDLKLLKEAVDRLHVFLAKMVTLNCHTICVANGSAVGGGLFMLFAHERTIMMNNPKFVCNLPEIPLGMVITPGLMKIT